MDTGRRNRTYNSRARKAQAQRNRDTILDIARTAFLAQGYAATTIASIAAQAGVAVDTVYKAFGGKAGLVRAIYERSLAGEGPTAAPQRSDEMQSTESDPYTVVHRWGVLGAEVAPLVAPIHLLVRDAASSDPDMAALLHASDRQRRDRMAHNARTLAGGGHLKPGVTVHIATDLMWTYSSPDMYELLVVRCGWDVRRYGQFIGDSLAAALLP